MNKGKAVKRAKEYEAAQKALDFLKDSLDAKVDVANRAIEQRLHAIKLTDIASEEREKYHSRWGGTEYATQLDDLEEWQKYKSRKGGIE